MNKKIYSSKVLELFFDEPEAALHIREIARQTKLNPNTVLRDVNLLVKENLLLKKQTRAVVEVRPNKQSLLFYRLKQLYNLRQLYLSGLVDILKKEYVAPEAIILFGSYSRGEDIKKSDIDVAVITKRHLQLNVKDIEKQLKRHVELHEIELEKVGRNFITTLANGIILHGYLNV